MFKKLFGGSKKKEDQKPEEEKLDEIDDGSQNEVAESHDDEALIEQDASIAAFNESVPDEVEDTAEETIEEIDEAVDESVSNVESASEQDDTQEAAKEELEEEVQPVTEKPKRSWFQRLTQGLSKSNNSLVSGIGNIFTKAKLDDDTIEALEDILIQADLGTDTAIKISEGLADEAYDKEISAEEIRQYLNKEVTKILDPVAKPLIIGDQKPYIILMTGVNGAGKTTSIGKLAAKFKAEGKKVMLAAGDTFRAAAVQQLVAWGERADVPVVSGKEGIDAASLAYEAIDQARKQDIDILMVDTAGRLQNRSELMDELEKVVRVIKKQDPTAPHASLLVLDATTGQNAVNQTQIFGERINISGLIMTKLDGSAKGGILVAIAAKFKLPVHFIGVGESIDDMEPFEAEQFANALTMSTQEGQ